MDFKRFLKLLAQYEGVKLTAYQDSGGIWTVGIGSIRHPNGDPVKKGDKITLEQAYQYAEGEAKAMLSKLKKGLKVPQTDEQMMALLSLAYNIGIDGLLKSTVLRHINAGKSIEEIEAAWLMWNKATINGKKVELKGLTTRRKSELKVYKGIVIP